VKQKPGRPALLTPNVEWKLMMPENLAALVEILCWDPVKQKPAFGARSAYLVELIRRDLKARGYLEAVGKESLTSSPEPDTFINGDGDLLP
jgi:hypothetical protein